MNIRGLIATSVALCTLAACSHKPNQQSQAWQSNQATRGTASDDSLTADQAKNSMINGIPFGIGCTKEKGHPISAWMDFYTSDNANNPVTRRYTASYSDVADLIQEANKTTNAIPGGKNRMIVSSGVKYWVTPSSVRVIDVPGDEGAYVADMRGVLKSTCSSRKELEEYGGEFGFTADETYLPVSIVGPYLSLQYSSSAYMGGAHPSSYVSFESRDTSKITTKQTGSRVAETKYSLFDVAAEADIVTALKGDKFLQKRLGAANLAAAKDTTRIHQLMVKKLNGDCEISVPEDKTAAFSQLAIYDYDAAKGNVLVRVGYSYGCEAARGNFTQLGLSLKPKPEFAAYLKTEVAAAAAQSRKPYFMRYSQQLK